MKITMRVLGREILAEAGRRYPDAAQAIEAWATTASRVAWQSLRDVRQSYPHADGVKLESGTIVTVFNIGGNKYLLLTIIAYREQIIGVQMFLTHADYNKQKWKRTI